MEKGKQNNKTYFIPILNFVFLPLYKGLSIKSSIIVVAGLKVQAEDKINM